MKNILLSIIVFFLLSCSSQNKKDDQNTILTLESSFEQDKGYALRLWCDSSYIYISTDPDYQIHMYNYSGRLLKSFGKKGPAPFENGELWYFTLDENKKNYWVHDYPKQLLKKFDLEKDSLVKTAKIITMNNVLFIGKNQFIIPRADPLRGTYLLSLYDTEKQEYIKDIDLLSASNAEFLKHKENLGFIFEGNFCHKNGIAVYFCYSLGKFFIINTKDFSLEIINDTRNLPIPEAIIKNGEIQLNPKQVASISSAANNEYLFSLTTKDASDIRKKGDFQIDIYNFSQKKYIGSLEVDKLENNNRPRKIALSENKLIILYESGIINIYKLNMDIFFRKTNQ